EWRARWGFRTDSWPALTCRIGGFDDEGAKPTDRSAGRAQDERHPRVGLLSRRYRCRQVFYECWYGRSEADPVGAQADGVLLSPVPVLRSAAGLLQGHGRVPEAGVAAGVGGD